MGRLARWVLPILILALAAGTAGTSFAGDTAPSAPQRTIDVVGKGTIDARPDTAVVTVGVTALKDTPTAAYKEIGAEMTRVAAAMKELGVKEDDIKTDMLTLGAEYNWTQDKGQELKGYRATTNIAITTHQLDQVAQLVETAVSSGANQLQSITFSIKDTQSLVNQALDLAADNARDKADRVARRMGATIGDVTKITVMDESGPVVRPPLMAGAAAKADAGISVPVFGGTNTITVTVSATFDLK